MRLVPGIPVVGGLEAKGREGGRRRGGGGEEEEALDFDIPKNIASER